MSVGRVLPTSWGRPTRPSRPAVPAAAAASGGDAWPSQPTSRPSWRAGRIDAKAALDRVIERIVDKQLGPGAPAAVREKVRTALERAVADDPLLSEKIKLAGA